ncbi:MAG: Crp/Fnr family transcriptional regulator [Lentilitoribacter sp.]
MLLAPFNTLPKEQLRRIECDAGDHLFRQGDKTHSIFFVVSGEVQLQRTSENGDLIVIHRAFQNEYFAEPSLFAASYHCDAVMNSNGLVISIKKALILKHMSVDHEFSIKVTKYLARQVQDYRRLLELRAIKSAKTRVLAGLQEGWHKGNIMSFASQLGLTHEATYRALNDLVRAGRVVKKKRGDYHLS